MEEDILQVVKYCTDLIDDKDLEKLDLIIKYMKRYAPQRPLLPLCFVLLVPSSLMSPQSLFLRLMQQSVESVWSMAFDFILDNVQVVVQQAYGSTLKITWGQRFIGFQHTTSPAWAEIINLVEIMIVLHLDSDNTASFAKTVPVASWTTDLTHSQRIPFLESWNKRLIETRELHSEFTQLANGDNRSSFLLFDRISYGVVY